MDFFHRHQTVPKPLLSYLLPFSRTFNCTSKRLAGSPKGWNWSQPAPNKVLLKVAHAFYTLMDFFQSQTVPDRFILPSSHFERSCTSKTTGWFTKRWSQLPHANKVLLQVHTHSYIHWWTSFSRTNCAKPLLSYLLPFSRTFNCTSKTTGWFTKGLKWSQPAPR
jgi:hypothetical protein